MHSREHSIFPALLSLTAAVGIGVGFICGGLKMQGDQFLLFALDKVKSTGLRKYFVRFDKYNLFKGWCHRSLFGDLCCVCWSSTGGKFYIGFVTC